METFNLNNRKEITAGRPRWILQWYRFVRLDSIRGKTTVCMLFVDKTASIDYRSIRGTIFAPSASIIVQLLEEFENRRSFLLALFEFTSNSRS